MKYVCSICNIEVQPNTLIRKYFKDFPNNPKQQEYIDMECKNFPNHYTIKRHNDAMKLTREERQHILELFKKGKTIGDIGIATNQTTDIVCAIISMNIETTTHQTLRETSK